jgi:predicted enzyme related to lactoylglutathione lyase
MVTDRNKIDEKTQIGLYHIGGKMSDHKIIHIELSAKDRKALSKFYSTVFGWETQDLDEMNYTTFKAGDGVGGGFNPVTEENPQGIVLVYIETDDITASLKEVQDAGGTILSPEMDIPNTGKFGIFRDPQGNTVGLFKPFPMP